MYAHASHQARVRSSFCLATFMASRAQRLEALAALKAARQGGVVPSKVEEDDDGAIYDEVTEETYQSLVRGRMMEDDFIEDDDGSGYVDHGQDEWAQAQSESDTEDERDYYERTGRKKPKKKGARRVARHALPHDYLGPRHEVRRAVPAPSKESEDAFMSKLFGGLEHMSTPARPMATLALDESHDSPSLAMARKRKQLHTPTTLPSLVPDLSSSTEPSSDALDDSWSDEASKKRKSDTPPMDEDDDFGMVTARRQDPLEAATRTSKPVHAPETPTHLQTWRSVHDGLATESTPVATPYHAATKQVPCFEEDGSVHFYWFDYYDDLHGTFLLVGKVLDKATGRFVSASVAIDGMERCLFLQPRPRIMVDGHETDRVPGEDEVMEEFESMRQRYGIQSWIGKWVSRKYAFELPDVPREGSYLKVKYGFDEPALPADVSGSTFCRAFGAHTSAFELFVVKRRIMGPCWLRLERANVRQGAPQTWTKMELSVDEPKCVAPFADTDAHAPKDAPPLTIMSLALRSVVNFKENKREIVAVSARVWRDMALEHPTPPEQCPSTAFTAVRPLGPSFPPRFEQQAQQSPTKIKAFKYERMVLNHLLSQIQLHDADVILSHDLVGSTLDILLHRLRDLHCDQWTRLGRMRHESKGKWHPVRALVGRLVADLSSDTAKGMIASTTWSLSEMCRTHLNTQREDIDPEDVPSFFDCTAPTPERLLTFVKHCEVDAFFQMAIASKVQLLALTKQLTNLAGNAWSRTLNGGRAERNEYILLHEFHKKKYLCPDKERKAPSDKKEKFKGGLVFEPKRGLWDKYVLVMDFNSLYPSIIQEFNIDFTTVERHGDDVPPAPSSDVAQGVLPHLIATLVNRRRQVKALMKDKHAPALKQLQWNIKQQALKLTANSMYGCLGYENSRFYARPLAALTTFKGREILSTTRELAESMSLDVIYGDTDSVMINTRCVDYDAAIKLGHEFRRAVNERYRLLEIDIDGVFQRMLLLQKKKYAALLVNEGGDTSTEIKGLDMKRREYCALSKQASAYVLEQILSGDATETVVERIHEYLQQLASDVREGRIPLDDYVIYKRLGKRPQDYPDAQNQPHVQVALRMLAKNESARSGDVIPYVFCAGSDAKHQAERAFHPDDVRRHPDDPTYAIDYKHYLSLQILPPIERLADSLEGSDRSRLAACLGLDVHTSHASEREFATLDSQVPSSVRFAHCDALHVRCPQCSHTSSVRPLAHSARSEAAWLACEACHAPWPLASLVVQLQLAIRAHIAQYYQGIATCSEPSCRATSDMTGVYSGRCVVAGCRGKVVAQYTDKALYTQLCFFAYLFDAAQAVAETRDTAQQTRLQSIVDAHRADIDALHGTVQSYLARNGRRFVGLGKLFSFMRM